MRLFAYVVLDPRHAAVVAGRERHVLPNGLAVVDLNRSETELLYTESFEQERYFQRGVEIADGACVIDVGANIGLFALAAHFRAAGVTIHTFESNPFAFDLLQVNAGLYGSTFARIAWGCRGCLRRYHARSARTCRWWLAPRAMRTKSRWPSAPRGHGAI